jgi:hypothetical protein
MVGAKYRCNLCDCSSPEEKVMFLVLGECEICICQGCFDRPIFEVARYFGLPCSRLHLVD